MSPIIGTRVPLHVFLDRQDLHTSLSTKKNSLNKSVRADVNVIRHEFEQRHVERIVWVPGKHNLVESKTKPDSTLSTALQPKMQGGRLAHSFDSAESCDADRPIG